MDQGIATFIAAILGGCAALIGGWIVGVRELRIEKNRLQHEFNKLEHAQLVSLSKEKRELLQLSIEKLASATHSMCWITWLSTVEPERINENRVNQYDEEMHRLLPQIIGLQARVATYSKDLGQKILEMNVDITNLDVCIATSSLKYIGGNKSCINELRECHFKSSDLHEKLARMSTEIDFEKLLPSVSSN